MTTFTYRDTFGETTHTTETPKQMFYTLAIANTIIQLNHAFNADILNTLLGLFEDDKLKLISVTTNKDIGRTSYNYTTNDGTQLLRIHSQDGILSFSKVDNAIIVERVITQSKA